MRSYHMEENEMEWVHKLNLCMNYIEEHLTSEIDYEQLGRIACCSAYHFQRMFTYMAGVTLSEYIRRRKMSLAAVDLQGGDAKVIDIAEKYGYEVCNIYHARKIRSSSQQMHILNSEFDNLMRESVIELQISK